MASQLVMFINIWSFCFVFLYWRPHLAGSAQGSAPTRSLYVNHVLWSFEPFVSPFIETHTYVKAVTIVTSLNMEQFCSITLLQNIQTEPLKIRAVLFQAFGVSYQSVSFLVVNDTDENHCSNKEKFWGNNGLFSLK